MQCIKSFCSQKNKKQKQFSYFQLVPVIQEVFPFQELPKAYEKLSNGHARGKIVVDMR